MFVNVETGPYGVADGRHRLHAEEVRVRKLPVAFSMPVDDVARSEDRVRRQYDTR